MDFKQLNTFVCIADAGSFTRAAQLCNIVQPALSKQMASLEEELGAALFIRSPQGASLTETGKLFYPHAQQLLKARQAALLAVTSSQENPTGTIQIGCINSLADSLGPLLIETINQHYPNITIDLLSDSAAKLYQSLLNASLDLAIVFKEVGIYNRQGECVHKQLLFDRSVLQHTLLFEEAVLFCSPQNSPASQDKQPLSPSALLQLPLLAPPTDHALSCCLDWFANSAKQQPEIVARTNSIEMIKTLITRNIGHALLPASALDEQIYSQPIEGYDIKRNIILCSSTQAPMQIGTQAVHDVIVKTLAGLG